MRSGLLRNAEFVPHAMWLSDALTGPGLGTRVGMAIGEPTAGYGNGKQYVTPVFHVPFQVSQVFFPPPKGPPQTDLPAQIQLPVTVADLQQGVNPVARWLGTLPKVRSTSRRGMFRCLGARSRRPRRWYARA